MHFSPGDHVRWFAKEKGWKVADINIIVEGESDQKYFELAAALYRKKYGQALIGSNLAIFPTGTGDDGGTKGIVEFFPLFKQLISMDTSTDSRLLFKAVALFDNDPMGKQSYKALLGKYTNFRENRDLFLLNRRLPRLTKEPAQLSRHILTANAPWKGLDCEIEDLVNYELLHSFVSDNPSFLLRDPETINDVHHFKFARHAKAPLFRYVQEVATIEDLNMIVDVLKSLRFYVGLAPDGDPI